MSTALHLATRGNLRFTAAIGHPVAYSFHLEGPDLNVFVMLEAAPSDEELIGGIELSTLLLADAKAIGLPLAIYTIKLHSDFSMPPSVQRHASDSEDGYVSKQERCV
jgi:hypothetical protein